MDKEALLKMFRDEKARLLTLGETPTPERVWDNVLDMGWGTEHPIPLRAFVVLLLGETFPT